MKSFNEFNCSVSLKNLCEGRLIVLTKAGYYIEEVSESDTNVICFVFVTTKLI